MGIDGQIELVNENGEATGALDAHGAYLTNHMPGPWHGIFIAALLFGHMMGLRLLVIAGIANKLLSPVLCPRRA